MIAGPRGFKRPRDPTVPPCYTDWVSSLFWIAEGVRCSRPAIPVGRMILTADGLYYIPGRRSAAARSTDQGWLSHALSDDDGPELAAFADVAAREPADQLAAITGSLHITPSQLVALIITGRVITITADTPLDFTLPPVLGARLTAWLTHMAAQHVATT